MKWTELAALRPTLDRFNAYLDERYPNQENSELRPPFIKGARFPYKDVDFGIDDQWAMVNGVMMVAIVQPYKNMRAGDRLRVRCNGLPVNHTVTEDEIGQCIEFEVSESSLDSKGGLFASHLQRVGEATEHQSITLRASAWLSHPGDDVFKAYVEDGKRITPHALAAPIVSLPAEGGIRLEQATSNVQVTIPAWANTSPGDKVCLFVGVERIDALAEGGWYIPEIKIGVDALTLIAARDDKLEVSYLAINGMGNVSRGLSPVVTVQVKLGLDLLVAPEFVDPENDVNEGWVTVPREKLKEGDKVSVMLKVNGLATDMVATTIRSLGSQTVTAEAAELTFRLGPDLRKPPSGSLLQAMYIIERDGVETSYSEVANKSISYDMVMKAPIVDGAQLEHPSFDTLLQKKAELEQKEVENVTALQGTAKKQLEDLTLACNEIEWKIASDIDSLHVTIPPDRSHQPGETVYVLLHARTKEGKKFKDWLGLSRRVINPAEPMTFVFKDEDKEIGEKLKDFDGGQLYVNLKPLHYGKKQGGEIRLNVGERHQILSAPTVSPLSKDNVVDLRGSNATRQVVVTLDEPKEKVKVKDKDTGKDIDIVKDIARPYRYKVEVITPNGPPMLFHKFTPADKTPGDTAVCISDQFNNYQFPATFTVRYIYYMDHCPGKASMPLTFTVIK
ncbi:hypothetical protein LOY46_13800 [Pseudomonas sichuanensis]|uniref:hypothetical protein n=1 Tax=Pseudomonas sichuanensis TaxID=2213015 RepID=UPI00215E8198|nr:hypothetical protein [Pseudomonas sichuanensis]UVK80669.1 hypothetical protein LOY46_13800 [Pseudomonas sichuanensis]